MSSPTPVDPAVGEPTTKPPKRRKENSEFIGFVSRSVRALRRRAADEGDLVALTGLAELSRQLDAELLAAITELRGERWAYSWQQIADALGVAKSSAIERFAEAGGVRPPGGQPGKWR